MTQCSLHKLTDVPQGHFARLLECHVIKASFLLSKPSFQNTDKDYVTGTGDLPNYASDIS
jgi:hypothetical protein